DLGCLRYPVPYRNVEVESQSPVGSAAIEYVPEGVTKTADWRTGSCRTGISWIQLARQTCSSIESKEVQRWQKPVVSALKVDLAVLETDFLFVKIRAVGQCHLDQIIHRSQVFLIG